MNRDLLPLLCDPEDQSDLDLIAETVDSDGTIQSGILASKRGRRYPIVGGIPRFEGHDSDRIKAVQSFGDEWNYFDYDLFKVNWLKHVVANTFGTPDVFRDKVIVDCGAGSGMQSRWMSELGARRVIALELSHSVDSVMKKNLSAACGVDVIQCSIDRPPIKPGAINGIVICHNVIQHTPSVAGTARALWNIVGPKGELVFNCYMKYPGDPLWMARWFFVYRPLRAVLSRCSFQVILRYAQVMASLRFIPLLGWLLEKTQFMVRGDVPEGPKFACRQWKSAVLNTYDWYGSHRYQHQLTKRELRQLLAELQPDARCINNLAAYFKRPIPPGTALRVTKM